MSEKVYLNAHLKVNRREVLISLAKTLWYFLIFYPFVIYSYMRNYCKASNVIVCFKAQMFSVNAKSGGCFSSELTGP